MSNALQKAEMDRGILVVQLATVEKLIANNGTTPLSLTAAEVQLEKINKLEPLVVECHARILYQSPADTGPHDREFVSINLRLDKARIQLREIIKHLTRPTTSTSAPPATQNIKLPEISLPIFDGRYEDWPSFEDLFQATVGSNATLSDAQRLQYLKACLKGDPSNLIKSFVVTDQNYGEAWTLLSSRYKNNREIVYSLGKKLVYQQALKSENVSGLQSLLNTTSECLRSLKVLSQPTDKLDCLLVPLIVEKLDPQTKAEWARTLTATTTTTFKEVTDFLESHIRSLIAKGGVTASVTSNLPHHKTVKFSNNQGKARSFYAAAAPPSCTMCKGAHYLYQCPKLLELEPQERMSAVKQTSACLNCLRDGHAIKHCKSKFTCRRCSRKHHSLLHVNADHHPSRDSKQENVETTTTNVAASSPEGRKKQRMFQTAVVDIIDSSGVKRPCRVMYDNCSDAEYITEKCASALGLTRSRADVIVEGVGGVKAAHTKTKVSTKLFSRVYNESIFVEDIYVLPKITGYVPKLPCKKETLTYINDIPLADPNFDQPGEVDILLGTGVVSYIMKDGIRPGKDLVAYNSMFGWVLSGIINIHQPKVLRTHHTSCKLEELVHRFWQVEQLPQIKNYTDEEKQAESHFQQTHQRKPDGRYKVRLPFNNKISSVGETRDLALRRLYSLERRFKKHPHHHEEYKKFMQEYLDLGHMEQVSSSPEDKRVFIPHHFVTKEDSTTTKLRVVFDASMKSSSGISLNDCLLVGPTIQDELFTQLVRFRTYNVALKADIAKMYRQFEVHEDDQSYQCILWRDDQSAPVQEYKLKTVTYGTACAPYLATRCLLQLAKNEQVKYPEAAKVLSESMYIDDLMGGHDSIAHSQSLVKELIELCKEGGLDIRKWCSSSEDVLKSIPQELQEVSVCDFDNDSFVKALGIRWRPQDDSFYFEIEPKSTVSETTKRAVLSKIARTFDPLGWLAPVTVIAKIMFQDLWRQCECSEWDSKVGDDILERWYAYQQQLPEVSAVHIPRRILPPSYSSVEMHGFADSSEKALGCCLYLRIIDSKGDITSHLITAKSKVAPLKATSLPKLELNAAVMLSELIESVLKCFNFEFTIHCWTDLMIVLSWLKSTTRRWKTYVANRVAAIQDVVPARCWNHVSSQDNPADLPSRGIPASELINNDLWWLGPSWLSIHYQVSTEIIANEEEVSKEERSGTAVTLISTSENAMERLFHYSSYQKIVSSAAWLMRFIKYLQQRKQISRGPLSTLERNQAVNKIIQYVQMSTFTEEYTRVKKGEPVPVKSRLSQLAPFINSNYLLCVGGRLQNADVNESSKHPIILPSHHPFTVAVVRYYHEILLHGGFSITLGSIRRKYWILRGRDVVRHITRKCVTCTKAKAVIGQQQMGSLPKARVTPHRPFLHSGVDFAGPFSIKLSKGRGVKSFKGYMAVFVCLSTKAVHLEAVAGLSTEDFIACYRRFVSRRGISSHLYSDQGTNFISADKEFKKMMEEGEEDLQQSTHGTTWVFNPPAAHHQLGLWEAAVKSAKYHLKRVVGNHNLTFDEFTTLLCNVEACLNSRPLCPLSSDPTDNDALTPGHFLISEPLMSIPEGDLTSLPENRLSHWQQVQQMTQHFWSRWRNEYLSTLQQRHKWRREQRNFAVGDLVIIKEDNIPPAKWKLGRIIKTHPGTDGLVRKAIIKTSFGELTRPIVKLCGEIHQGHVNLHLAYASRTLENCPRKDRTWAWWILHKPQRILFLV